MKCMAPAFLAALATSLGAAQAGEFGNAVQPNDIRKEMLSEYRFSPVSRDAGRTAAPRSEGAPVEAGVVIMATYAVREPAKLNELHARIVQSQADARQAAVAAELGIGVSSVPIGDHFALAAATVFHIPITIAGVVTW